MTKDEFQKAVDDVIEDCIRNDYTFGSYAHRVTEAVWPLFEAAEKERDALRAMLEDERKEHSYTLRAAKAEAKQVDTLRAKIAEMERQVPICRAEDLANAQSLLPSLGLKPEDPLYALPGAQAQPAPNVPAVPTKSLKPVIDWLRNGCDPIAAADELELLIAAAPKAKP